MAKELLNKVKILLNQRRSASFLLKRIFVRTSCTTSRTTDDLPTIYKTKFCQTVMVFRCVFSKVDAMPLCIFEQCLRFNLNVYVELMNTIVKLWLERLVTMCGSKIQYLATPPESLKSNCHNFYDFTSSNI